MTLTRSWRQFIDGSNFSSSGAFLILFASRTARLLWSYHGMVTFASSCSKWRMSLTASWPIRHSVLGHESINYCCYPIITDPITANFSCWIGNCQVKTVSDDNCILPKNIESVPSFLILPPSSEITDWSNSRYWRVTASGLLSKSSGRLSTIKTWFNPRAYTVVKLGQVVRES